MGDETYSGHKAMDLSEIWRNKLLRYTNAIGSRIFKEISVQNVFTEHFGRAIAHY